MAGLVGAGRSETARVIFGADRHDGGQSCSLGARCTSRLRARRSPPASRCAPRTGSSSRCSWTRRCAGTSASRGSRRSAQPDLFVAAASARSHRGLSTGCTYAPPISRPRSASFPAVISRRRCSRAGSRRSRAAHPRRADAWRGCRRQGRDLLADPGLAARGDRDPPDLLRASRGPRPERPHRGDAGGARRRSGDAGRGE